MPIRKVPDITDKKFADRFKRVAVKTQSLAETARHFEITRGRASQIAQALGLKIVLIDSEEHPDIADLALSR